MGLVRCFQKHEKWGDVTFWNEHLGQVDLYNHLKLSDSQISINVYTILISDKEICKRDINSMSIKDFQEVTW